MPLDLSALAQSLIDKHGRKTERLANVLRGTARTHYAAGVSDCLLLMQQAAVAEEAGEAHPVHTGHTLPVITAPLAVQAAHSATDEGTI